MGELFTQEEHDYMDEALRLAEKGRGFTRTNPLVGAVVVKEDTVIGKGYHARYGGPHAEVNALRKAGSAARGATLYVTLEPCSTYGKTPPCTDAIIAHGIARVVVAMKDPNSVNANRGIRILKKHGVDVSVGLCRKEAEGQNVFFMVNMSKKRPYVRLKMAQSFDGKSATRTGHSQWITGLPARRRVHMMRAQSDAILVGKGTVLKDNPSLTVRLVKAKRQPARIVLDARGEIPLSKKVFQRAKEERVIVVVGPGVSGKRLAEYARKGVEVVAVPARGERLDIKKVLAALHRCNIASVFVEGGGAVAGSLIDAKVVDAVSFFYAPIIIGGTQAMSSVEGVGAHSVHHGLRLANARCEKIGDDFLFEGDVVG